MAEARAPAAHGLCNNCVAASRRAQLAARTRLGRGEDVTMQGLMQRHPLLLSTIIAHAGRHHPRAEIVSAPLDPGAPLHRTDYAAVERRARLLLSVLRE